MCDEKGQKAENETYDGIWLRKMIINLIVGVVILNAIGTLISTRLELHSELATLHNDHINLNIPIAALDVIQPIAKHIRKFIDESKDSGNIFLYLFSKNNVLNIYLAKKGWLILIVLMLILWVYRISNMILYSIQNSKIKIVKRRLFKPFLRILVATSYWYLVCNIIFESIKTYFGGHCYHIVENVVNKYEIHKNFYECSNNDINNIWVDTLDISGHTFMISLILLIVYKEFKKEYREFVYLNENKMIEYKRKEIIVDNNHNIIVKIIKYKFINTEAIEDNFKSTDLRNLTLKLEPVLNITILLVIIGWIILLIITTVFFHVLIERVIAFIPVYIYYKLVYKT